MYEVGYVQTIPGAFTPGITLLQRTSGSSVGHSYPYPELLDVLLHCNDIHTRTRNF